MGSPKPSPKNKLRLQKYLAQCGVASRRAAERLIDEGRVLVDGNVVTRQGVKVDPSSHHVQVDGRAVHMESETLFLFHKPPRVVCTVRDPEGRTTVLDFFREEHRRLYPVGRLDVMSEGLLLITNRGELAHRLTHPSFHIEKEYQVTLSRTLSASEQEQLCRGIREGEEMLRAHKIDVDRRTPVCSTWILREGKNRQIRRMAAALGVGIVQLRRTRIGPLLLGSLKSGEWRAITEPEQTNLYRAAGLSEETTRKPISEERKSAG